MISGEWTLLFGNQNICDGWLYKINNACVIPHFGKIAEIIIFNVLIWIAYLIFTPLNSKKK